MKIKILLLLAFSSLLLATTTTTTFSNENANGENEYGDKLYTRDVTINTQNYNIEDFFTKSLENNNSLQLHSTGRFLITVEANSICTNDDSLDEEGCSGQKPFLMKKSFVDGMEDGETYEVPFAKASQFGSENESFFALDVDRDMEYFEQTTTSEGRKSFFDRIKELFKDHFSHDTMSYGDNLTGDENKARDRYIANILSGIQKSKRLTKKIDDKTSNTPINSTINTPVSLLDYDSLITTKTTGCNIGFVNLSSSSLTCKMINGFHMGEWMPFFNQTDDMEVSSSTTMIDTETSLLSAVGELNGVNVFEDMKSDMEGRTSFFGEIFKPVTFMFSKMINFFFGSSNQSETVVFSNHYDFTKYPKLLTMTIPLTNDGSQVDDFANFSLVGLDSVYGAEVEYCKFKQDGFLFFDKHYEIEASGTNYNVSLYIDNYEDDYDLLDFSLTGGFFIKDVLFDTNRDDLMDWCARNQRAEKSGIFGRIISYISNLFEPIPSDKAGQIDKLMADRNFVVEEYKEKIHRGLILHLKKEDLSTNNPANKITIKFLKSIK